jgi:uncharacterized protein
MSHPSFQARLILEATVSPSEDPQKVAAALGNVVGLGTDAVTVGNGSARLIAGEAKALEHVRDQLRDRRIRSAARRQLLVNGSGVSTSLMLNRQAAAAGVVAVCGTPEESPLGPIYLTLSSNRLTEAIDWLTAYSGDDISRVRPS